MSIQDFFSVTRREPSPPIPAISRRQGLRWTRALLALATTTALLGLSGCGATKSSARYSIKPQAPLKVEALRVAFLETDYRLTGERPYLSSDDVNRQREIFSQAFHEVFPQAMGTAGIPTVVKSATDKTIDSPEMNQWLGAELGKAHVLIVAPSGGRVFCTGGPCNFRFGLQAMLFSPDIPPQQVWAVQLTQPDLTPGMTLGSRGDFEHYTRELARILLKDTTSNPAENTPPRP